MKTFEQLKPQCADEGASYAERKAKREAEIKSLEQAWRAQKARFWVVRSCVAWILGALARPWMR